MPGDGPAEAQQRAARRAAADRARVVDRLAEVSAVMTETLRTRTPIVRAIHRV